MQSLWVSYVCKRAVICLSVIAKAVGVWIALTYSESGILVGTLGVAGFLDAVALVRRLARAAGKRTYTVLMGKPNPEKLANFPEMDVWVLVGDSQVSLYVCAFSKTAQA